MARLGFDVSHPLYPFCIKIISIFPQNRRCWYNVPVKFIVIFYGKTKLILKLLISFTLKHYSLFSSLNEEHVKWLRFMSRPDWNISFYWCNIFSDEQQSCVDLLTLFNTHTHDSHRHPFIGQQTICCVTKWITASCHHLWWIHLCCCDFRSSFWVGVCRLLQPQLWKPARPWKQPDCGKATMSIWSCNSDTSWSSYVLTLSWWLF